MDDKTLEALKASIKHWQDNAKAETPEAFSYNAGACALCGLFNRPVSYESACIGCPVMAKTGYGLCSNTPYVEAVAAAQKWRDYPSDASLRRHVHLHAKAEVAFLQSILIEELERRVSAHEETILGMQLPYMVPFSDQTKKSMEEIKLEQPTTYVVNLPVLSVGESYTIAVKRQG